jgi:N-glycosylase/DNA lyase
MTRKIYLQSEQAFKELAQELGMSLAELDLYVFYLKTGKVLK